MCIELVKGGGDMQRIQVDENTIVYRPEIPDRDALIELYDILNEINMREKRNNLFYTEEQVAELKRNAHNIFL